MMCPYNLINSTVSSECYTHFSDTFGDSFIHLYKSWVSVLKSPGFGDKELHPLLF
jgi:hypothetical protein